MHDFDVAILGAGSFGTAVAIHLAQHQKKVMLWGRDKNQISVMQAEKVNNKYLPGIPLPANIAPEASLQTAISNAKHLILSVPSHVFAELLKELPDNIKQLIWLTKGIDPNTDQFLHERVLERYPTANFGILSGPSFAKEVARNMPTAVTLACNNSAYAKEMQALLHTPTLRVYLSEDYVGIQLASAMKNVLAIAVGISDGLGYGANARAALITRGLHEMQSLGNAFNANPKTFTGLTGLGDLVLTATDNQSRNRRYGLAIGGGQNTLQAAKEIEQVVEGQHNAKQICALGKAKNIELPICTMVNKLINQHITPDVAVKTLLNRPASYEY